jgi:hypothetical protein
VKGRTVVALWALATAVSAVTGVLNIAWDWNAIPIALGSLRFEFTLYPAFPLALLCAVWLGPGWGAVPIYLANLAGAIAGGVPFPVDVAFAAAGAIELLIVWGLLVALDVDPDLGRVRDFFRFVAAVAVAAVIASTSVIVWNASRGHDFSAGQRLWYAWVAGDVLQSALLAAPAMRWLGPRARAWVRARMATPPRSDVSYARVTAMLAVVLATLGVLIFAGFGMVQDSLERDLSVAAGRTELRLRLFQVQLFLGILVLALVVATGLVSTALVRRGDAERRRREGI